MFQKSLFLEVLPWRRDNSRHPTSQEHGFSELLPGSAKYADNLTDFPPRPRPSGRRDGALPGIPVAGHVEREGADVSHCYL